MTTKQDVWFESAGPSAVKSIRQRDLLNAWLRARETCGGTPHFEAFQPERISDEMPDLVFFHVEHKTGYPTILIKSDGSRLADAYGRRGSGQELATYLGAHHANHVMPIYHACITRGLPTYSIAQVTDTGGVKVDYERLLLPFSGTAGETSVSRIMASMKTISEDGAFNLRNLMRGPNGVPTYLIRAVIDRDLVQARPVGRGVADTIEFC